MFLVQKDREKLICRTVENNFPVDKRFCRAVENIYRAAENICRAKKTICRAKK